MFVALFFVSWVCACWLVSLFVRLFVSVCVPFLCPCRVFWGCSGAVLFVCVCYISCVLLYSTSPPGVNQVDGLPPALHCLAGGP